MLTFRLYGALSSHLGITIYLRIRDDGLDIFLMRYSRFISPVKNVNLIRSRVIATGLANQRA